MSTAPKPRPRARPTHNERLLAWARKGHSLDQNDWWNGGPDGGSAIKGLRSRVAELEGRGFLFEHITRPGRLARYRLLTEPGDLQPEAASEHTSAVAPEEPQIRPAEIEQLALDLPANPASGSAVYGRDWDIA